MIAIKIFFAGLIILIGAIVANALANFLGVTGWYDFLKKTKGQRDIRLSLAIYNLSPNPRATSLLSQLAIQ